MAAERRAVAWPWLAVSVVLVGAWVWRNMAILGDGFWTLATGHWVLAHHALPATDPFAYASVPGRWIVHMPLTMIAFAWIDAHVGLRAVMIAGAAIELAAVLVLWLGNARTLAARVSTLPLAIFFVMLGADDLSVRGQLFGDLGFAVLLLCLVRLERGARVHAAIPIVLGALWANTHPSFLIAIALPLGVAALSRLDPGNERAAPAPLIRFGALATAGTFLNPYGPLLHVDVARLFVDPTTASVDLFRSPDFHAPIWIAAIASGLGLAGLRLAVGIAPRKRSDAALVLLLVAATCWARRYGTLLVAAELAVAGAALSHEAPAAVRRRVTATSLGTLAALEFGGAIWLAPRHVDPLRDVPADAVAFIHDHALPDNVMNPYHWGGYLEYAWRGEKKAFIDGRNQLFGNGAYDDRLVLDRLAPGWDAVLDIYEVQTVLAERGSQLDAVLAHHPEWQLAYRGRLADVIVRRPAPTPRRKN